MWRSRCSLTGWAGPRRERARSRPSPRSASLDLAKKETTELSGGERQRVAIARALVTSPVIIFADEPTGALDSLSGERVMEILAGRCRDHGTAVLLVTHEPRVAAYADREVKLVDGCCDLVPVSPVAA